MVDCLGRGIGRFGMLAIASPTIAAIAVNAFIAWMIVFAGVVHLVLAFHAHRTKSLIWKVLVADWRMSAFGTLPVDASIDWRGLVDLVVGVAIHHRSGARHCDVVEHARD